MEISQLDKDYIENEKIKSVKNAKGILSCDSYKKGWDAAIKFAKKVEEADYVCEQCGKLISIENSKLDAWGIPFCKKCYKTLK